MNNAVNHSIRAFKIRVIKDEEQVGIMSKQDALNYASSLGLDLIEVAKQDNISVCTVADYGKFKYNQGIKEKQRHKKQIVLAEKELFFSPNIEKHDFDVLIKKLRDFIDQGCNVQITIRSKPKKVQPHKDVWFGVMNNAIAAVSDISEVISVPIFSGKRITARVAPKKKEIGA